jgi:hypothetical protein
LLDKNGLACLCNYRCWTTQTRDSLSQHTVHLTYAQLALLTHVDSALAIIGVCFLRDQKRQPSFLACACPSPWASSPRVAALSPIAADRVVPFLRGCLAHLVARIIRVLDTIFLYAHGEVVSFVQHRTSTSLSLCFSASLVAGPACSSAAELSCIVIPVIVLQRDGLLVVHVAERSGQAEKNTDDTDTLAVRQRLCTLCKLRGHRDYT